MNQPFSSKNQSAQATMSANSLYPTNKSQSSPSQSESKKPWWKRLMPSKKSAATSLEPTPPVAVQDNTAARQMQEMKEMRQRHDDLMGRMKEVCDVMERRAKQPAPQQTGALPPIPSETLDSWKETQDQVSGTLGRIDSQLEASRQSQSAVAASLEKVDRSVGQIDGAARQSLQAVDRVQSLAGTMTDRADTMEKTAGVMSTDIKDSHAKFQKMFENMQEAERGFVEEFAKLQKRSMWTSIGLGTAVIVSVITLALIVIYGS
ncbi:MAG: hypothetical protein ACQKBY_07715 [Verrucomicrobiales bacterium]